MEPGEESLQSLGGNGDGEDAVGRRPAVPALEASSDAPSSPTRSRRSARRTSSVSKTAGPPPYRSRSLATPLPAAFPPPPRGRVAIASDGDGDERSSNRTSPEIDQSRVSAQGLDVGHELELSVPSHQEHLTADGQRNSAVFLLSASFISMGLRYTTYEVMVRMGGRQWSVRKRYSQFDQFRMSLRKQHKEVGSFRFPHKSKFNTFAEHTKERRRTGFDEFLRLVANLHPRPEEVDVFLAMDEHGAGVRGRSGSRPLAWTSAKTSPLNPPPGPALGRVWSGSGRANGGRRLSSGSGVVRNPKGGTVHRIPRFPPLADQGRNEKAAEAAAAAAAAAAASSSRNGLSGVVHQADMLLRRILGPDLLSMLCVVAVSAVSTVGVWKVGGSPGLATLVMAVAVGLLVQNWDRGLDLLNLGLDLLRLDSAHPPSPSRQRTASYASSQSERSRAGLRPPVTRREAGRQ